MHIPNKTHEIKNSFVHSLQKYIETQIIRRQFEKPDKHL